ncbi:MULTISPECIES: cupin domain-containing protein [Bacillus cereus group]|uniref:cupin domain-containing protein n=1 Tax=Bacillus cereus group TaxID=86661 RepID=UPI000CD9066B|nr:cupin domain-containing protein [Bacillus thuringiensis]QFQ28452.1 cupin domain-containing protein [Bacillus thuringiensis]
MLEIKKKNLLDTTKTIKEKYMNFLLESTNDHCIRLAVFTGEYEWHFHPDSDEVFMVLEGQLYIDLENDETITVNPNEMVKIPAGVLHRTRSNVRTVNLCFEKDEAQTVFAEGVVRE